MMANFLFLILYAQGCEPKREATTTLLSQGGACEANGFAQGLQRVHLCTY